MSHALEDNSDVDSVSLLMQDKGWIGVQIKAFTAWLNQTIAHRSNLPKVTDLSKDLRDGVIVVNFFELLAGKKLRERWTQKPKHRIEKIQNCHLALTFMEKEMQVKNPGIGAEEIVDTNVKLILGLLWTLYRKYRIAVISHEGRGAEEGLLAWVKETTKDYQHVNIDKWNNSFQDGMAFLALTNAFNPEASGVKYGDYSPSNRKQNLEAAFKFAEDELGVPQLLDADQVATGEVDERSLILYASLFFHAFKAMREKDELEAERRRKEAAIEEEQRRGMQLESDNKTLWQLIEDLNQQIASTTAERDELIDRAEKFNKQLERLKEKDSELAAEKERLRKEIEEMEERIKELKKKLEAALSNMSQSEKELSAQLADAVDKASSLQKGQAQLELDIANYKSQIEDLTDDLKRETAERELREKEVEQNAYRNKVMLEGLGVLKKNTHMQTDDIKAWRGYIEYNKDPKIDFSPKNHDEKLSGDFLKELEDLSAHLLNENGAMKEILATQLELYEKKEAERLKKEAQKKAKAKQAKQSK